ncbi:MAG: hypothetical protein Q9190_001982 [Brigantiaea leucoxantha]
MAAAESGCLASTGIVTVTPGSINTVPGLVSFTLDLRAAEDARLMRLESQLKADFEKIAQGAPVGDLNKGGISGRACTVEWVLEFSNTAVKFDPDCINCVRESARDVFGAQTASLTQDMVSGAGHDSVFTSKRVPTSMIFVPCREGVSHNPAEYCAPEDCATGAQVLLGAVLRYDQMRATGAY